VVKAMKDSLIDITKFRYSWESRTTETHGITLVSLYGENKPVQFSDLLDNVLTALRSNFADWINSYEKRFIHSTIVSLEGRINQYGKIVNAHLLDRVGDQPNIPEMDFKGLLSFFRSTRWPLKIQIGGFQPVDNESSSCSWPAFGKTFEIQNNGLFVMKGWPVLPTGQPFAPTLLKIRKAIERFNIVYKYHVNNCEKDDSFFFVLGSIDFHRWIEATKNERVSFENDIVKMVTEIRASLVNNPYVFEVGVEDMWIVEYYLTTLQRVGFCKQLIKVTPEELHDLYR